MKTNVTPGETPEKITVSMIDQDLKNGISKPEMAIKYGIKPWEVDEMFKHPFLKGRRPSKKKPLSFIFEDDTEPSSTVVEIDPNQVTLEQAIEESTKEIETAVDRLADVNNAVVDMLSPIDETPEETLLKAAADTLEVTGLPKGETEKFISDTLKVAENYEENEIEVDDNTFDL